MFVSRKYIGQLISTYKKLAIIRRMSLETNSKLNRIAICHMRSTNDTEKNRLQVTEIVQRAKAENANVSKNANIFVLHQNSYIGWYFDKNYYSIFPVCIFTGML